MKDSVLSQASDEQHAVQRFAQQYRGRFAPSPTGPLHFGSLVAAVGSYLDAKSRNGTWLIRIEDLDTPRCVPGATEHILRTLDGYGLGSDEPVMYQSQRTESYREALQQLLSTAAVYPCCCTRREIADSALHGIDGPVYPGTCRNGIPSGRAARAWRLRTDIPPLPPPFIWDGIVQFDDALQGKIMQHIEREVGDFVVKRADGLFAYQLAVVVDDAEQRITEIVRGADLLDSTPRQIYLQQLLGLATPAYMHLPVAVNTQGEKLSKQTLAQPVDVSTSTLYAVLQFLRQSPPPELRFGPISSLMEWAVANWQPKKLSNCRQVSI